MSDPISPERLAEISARVEAASAGPWFAEDWSDDFGSNKTTVAYHTPEVLREGQSNIWPDGIAHHRVADTDEGDKPLEDAAFIAAARQDVPDLVREVERLRKALTNVAGCFDAAFIEGLSDRLAEQDDQSAGTLVDLVKRRLLFANDFARNALQGSQP